MRIHAEMRPVSGKWQAVFNINSSDFSDEVLRERKNELPKQQQIIEGMSPNCLMKNKRRSHRRTCTLLKKFFKKQGWLLLTCSIFLHNQSSSFNSVIVQMSGKRDSSNRQ